MEPSVSRKSWQRIRRKYSGTVYAERNASRNKQLVMAGVMLIIGAVCVYLIKRPKEKGRGARRPAVPHQNGAFSRIYLFILYLFIYTDNTEKTAMKKYLKTDEWNIIEDSFRRPHAMVSIFSLGNDRFGQRGYF